MHIADAVRFVRTIRHLRRVQIFGQVRTRLRRFVQNPRRFARQPVPPFPGCHWRLKTGFLAPGPQQNDPAQLSAGRFTFLNQTEGLGWPPQWSGVRASKLWTYNLFYFEYLWALEYEEAKRVVRDWIEHHPLTHEHIGWQPYPTSLRLMNWCAVFWGKYRTHIDADPDFAEELWQTVFLQAQWLTKHLETHLMGNHLFENAAALAFVGCCFAGPAAANWGRIGVAWLREELKEQFLPDGGHFERSPMYQSRIVYVLATLMNVAEGELRELVEPYLASSMRWLRCMVHPDTQIALFNDSAFRIYNAPEALAQYFHRLSPRESVISHGNAGAFALSQSGYYGWRGGNEGNYLVCDAGKIGPDYLPGHAHGDIFSFELSLSGLRVIVDSGVHDYEPGPRRQYCRSTRAHNTIEIDGQDQCEFWAAFRVARRGRPRDVQWESTNNGFKLSGWHDGYLRLPARARHRREFVWHVSGVLMVRDTTTARAATTAVSRLHLHPDCRIEEIDHASRSVRVSYPAGVFRIHFAGQGEIGTEGYPYCPEFGRELPGQAITLKAVGVETKTAFCVTAGPDAVQFDWEKGAYAHGYRCGW